MKAISTHAILLCTGLLLSSSVHAISIAHTAYVDLYWPGGVQGVCTSMHSGGWAAAIAVHCELKKGGYVFAEEEYLDGPLGGLGDSSSYFTDLYADSPPPMCRYCTVNSSLYHQDYVGTPFPGQLPVKACAIDNPN